MLKIANIPKPSNDILQLVTEITSTDIPQNVHIVNNPNSTDWWSVHLTTDRNIVKATLLYSGRLTAMIREQYGTFFKNHILNTYVAIFENTNPVSPAYYVPHTDSQRMITLNYHLDYGGDNATLSLYNECDRDAVYKVKHWSELTLLQQYQLKTSNWHCFDTKRFHSVDNIQTRRIFISVTHMNPALQKPGPPTYDKETDSFEAVTTMYPDIFQDYNFH